MTIPWVYDPFPGVQKGHYGVPLNAGENALPNPSYMWYDKFKTVILLYILCP